MADIAPFRALRYDEDTAGPLSALVAPPYDVISQTEHDELSSHSPHNVVRVILPSRRPDDSDTAPYDRAAARVDDWTRSGILVRDERPALYLYRQCFTDPVTERRRSRTGFFCALRLEPYASGVVLPHEETRPKAKEDRLRLMRATHANTEPIFALYEDPGCEAIGALIEAAAGRTPDASADVAGDTHEIWAIADGPAVNAIVGYLRGRRVWIADGHHRYETALTYRDELRASGRATPGDPADSLLVVLAPFEDPGMVILPTHRRVETPGLSQAAWTDKLAADFDLTPCDRADLTGALAPGVIGAACADGCWTLRLRSSAAMDAVGDKGSAWRALDVARLQTLILDKALGIPASAIATSAAISYERDAADAVEWARSEDRVAFILPRPTATELRDVSAQGDKMPPKSTYFYPKLWSGLVLRRLGDEEA